MTENYRTHAIVGDPQIKKDRINRLVSAVVKENGRIDVLINNTGVSFPSNNCYNEDIWDRTFEVNLKGAFLSSSKVAELMKKKRNGSIINITSLGAELGFPGNPSYVASKKKGGAETVE